MDHAVIPSVEGSAGAMATKTESFIDFPQSLQAKVGVVPHISLRPHPYRSTATPHTRMYIALRFDAVYGGSLTMAAVRKRTIPIGRPLLLDEISVKLCG
jgi:hypothetical protein